ncbi:MAG: LysM domain-containing protein [Calditrichaeota bacterium]|nr:MAG: LysM domain-containing protein [Calditrichota bacterium]
MEHPIPDDASLPQMSAISWSELSQGWGYGFSDKSVTRFDVPEIIPSITEEDYSENSLLAEVKPGIDRGGAIPIPITLSPASDSEERIELAELEIPIKTDDITQMGRSSSVSTTSPEFSSPSRGNAYFDEQQFYTSLVEEEKPESRAVEFLFLEEPEETVHLSDKRLPEEYRKIWLSKPLAELTSERKGEVIDTQAFLYKIHLQEKNTPEWVYADFQQDERKEYLPKPGIESRAPVSTVSLSESPTNSSKTEINVAGVESYSFLNDPSPSTSPGEGGKYRGNTHLAISEIVLLLKNKLQPQDDHIIVFPQETIGQISEWLKMSPYRLRKLNHLKRGNKIYTGQRLKVDFSRVSREVFLQKRLLFHLEILQHYLQHRHNVQIVQHRVKPGENLWYLAHRRYNFPVNLLLYFNDFDKLERLYPGDVINLPQIN